MRAATVTKFDQNTPVNGLTVQDLPQPEAQQNWTVVQVKAASLNHHDIWSLRGVGLRESQLPMVLGTDAAGVTPDGTRVVVHGVIGADGHGVSATERRSLLSEKYWGGLAEYVAVPTANLVPIPDSMSFETAACLPTAWLTAYSLLFRGAQLVPGQSVLIQGAGGGVASAATTLARHAGLTTYVTSRSPEKLTQAEQLGAIPVQHGARLPQRVDAVIETVGKATWSHSAASLKPGGIIAVAGATTGDPDAAELTRIFFQELRVQGVTMGTREDLSNLVELVSSQAIEIPIDSVYPLEQISTAMDRLVSGGHFGKIVVSLEQR